MALSLTLLTEGWSVRRSYESYQDISMFETRHLRMKELRSAIIHLDEVL
jgi:hypothetical protein